MVAILAEHSGKCLDVAGASRAEGAPVLQWECNGLAHQLWTVRNEPDGVMRLVARHSGKCLTIAAYAGSEEARRAVQRDCTRGRDDPEQVWRMVRTTPGGRTFRLLSVAGGCLDVAGSSMEDGAAVLQYPCSSTSNQEWALSLPPADGAGSARLQ